MNLPRAQQMAPPSGEETPNPYPLTDNTETTTHLPGPLSTSRGLNTTQLKADFLAFKKLFMDCLGDTHDKEELV